MNLLKVSVLKIVFKLLYEQVRLTSSNTFLPKNTNYNYSSATGEWLQDAENFCQWISHQKPVFVVFE